MLRTLSIRDVVLIGRLDLTYSDGLSVLTGETGAGKSILLDALGLALGVRAEARLVRHGAEQASVTASFDLPMDHPVQAQLKEQGLDSPDGEVILRRILTPDGRSRAFINDQSASVSLLRTVGDALVEVHGQFESQRLLDPKMHRSLLDAFGGLKDLVAIVREDFTAWQETRQLRIKTEQDLIEAKRDEEYLRHAVAEIAALKPEEGEESNLAEKRSVMMHGEKLMEAMDQAAQSLRGGKGVEENLRAAIRYLDKVAEKAEGRLDAAIAALDRAAEEVAVAVTTLDRTAADMDINPQSLDMVEERLFALRALARKHNVEVDGLAALHDSMVQQLEAVEDGSATLDRLRKEEEEARAAYVSRAYELSKARETASARMDEAINIELEPLRLGTANFVTRIEGLDENDWGSEGCDRVAFEVSTNPGNPPGPLGKIASGGEMARFMLALKVVLAGADPVPTLVFDEVDAGIGGATASAVGERLAILGRDVQVLVITHSPQVAAMGAHHWLVSKSEVNGSVNTFVEALEDWDRSEEVARMLAGSTVTEEARAAAKSLLGAREGVDA